MPDHKTPPLSRNTAFQRLMAGSMLSMLGSRLTTIAYPLLVLAWHGSPVIAGLAVCAANAPSVLVYIPAGALVDRSSNPRRTLMVAETVRGLAIAAIVFALLFSWKWIPLIVAVAIVEESFEAVATLAESRYVRELVEPTQVSGAQVSMEARAHVVVLAGRVLGGWLFGLAQFLPFAADFVSFVISVASLVGIGRGKSRLVSPAQVGRPKRLARPTLKRAWKEVRTLGEEIRAGSSELLEDAFAFHASLFSAGMTLISQALIIVFLASAHKQVSSVVIGSVLAASGFGGLFGAVVSRRSLRPWNKSPLKFQPLIWVGMLFILALATLGQLMVPVMAVVMAVLGLAGAMGNVELDTYLFAEMPKEKLARVTSIEMLLDFLAGVLGPAMGGLLVEAGGTEVSIWVLVGASAAITVPALRLKAPSNAQVTEAPEWRKDSVDEAPQGLVKVRLTVCYR